MILTPREKDKLLVAMAAMVARQRLARGVKLNHPEAIALITDFIGIDEQSLELLSAIVRHNDISAYWIYDDIEISAWPGGHYQVVVDGQKVGFDLLGNRSDNWLTQWQSNHRDQIESLTLQFNIPLLAVCCNRDISAQIVNNLALK